MTLSTLDIKRPSPLKTGFAYLVATIFCALFGSIYELFSHEVYSYFMIYAFAFPLLGGVLPFYLLFLSKRKMPGRLSLSLYHSGIATLTMGSVVEGVLAIYGTTNQLTLVYWILGSIFVVSGILLSYRTTEK